MLTRNAAVVKDNVVFFRTPNGVELARLQLGFPGTAIWFGYL
jgi:hypothetical protein